jgi:hypothetical protein
MDVGTASRLGGRPTRGQPVPDRTKADEAREATGEGPMRDRGADRIASTSRTAVRPRACHRKRWATWGGRGKHSARRPAFPRASGALGRGIHHPRPRRRVLGPPGASERVSPASDTTRSRPIGGLPVWGAKRTQQLWRRNVTIAGGLPGRGVCAAVCCVCLSSVCSNRKEGVTHGPVRGSPVTPWPLKILDGSARVVRNLAGDECPTKEGHEWPGKGVTHGPVEGDGIAEEA